MKFNMELIFFFILNKKRIEIWIINYGYDVLFMFVFKGFRILMYNKFYKFYFKSYRYFRCVGVWGFFW